MPTSTNYRSTLSGQQITGGNLGDSHEIVETYTIEAITDDLVAITDGDLDTLITELHLPKIGDVYVSKVGGTANDMWLASARLNDYTLQVGPCNIAQLSLRYTTLYLAKDTTSEPILPSTIEYSSASRTTELFRLNSNPAPSGLDSSTADIGGDPATVGAGARGKMIDVWQIAVRVRVVRDASKVSNGMVDVLTLATDLVGKRNSVLFLGLQPQTVECRAVSAQKLDNEFYEVVYDFIYDEYAWHDQEPEVYPEDGSPAIEETSPGVFDYVDVRWKRQTRDTDDFNDIWPVTAQKDYAVKGWW